jgi:hypothetical protein
LLLTRIILRVPNFRYGGGNGSTRFAIRNLDSKHFAEEADRKTVPICGT